MTRRWLFLLLVGCALFMGNALASTVSFDAKSTLHQDGGRLSGVIRLTLRSGRPIYHVQVVAQDQTATHPLATLTHWDPNTEQSLTLNLVTPGLVAGQYNLLLSLHFQDVSGYWTGVAMAIPYGVGGKTAEPTVVPSLTVRGAHLVWHPGGVPLDSLVATVTNAPWLSLTTKPYTPADGRLQLAGEPGRRYPANAQIGQLARLDWQQQGVHHSRILNWQMNTDGEGVWQQEAARAGVPFLVIFPWLLRLLALLLFLMALFGGPTRWEPPFARGGLLVLTLWPLLYLSVDLWMLETWPTGGDLASHAFYAQVFTEMVAEGRISGWLPEVFAGFPAFIHYFPLPFLLVAGLATLVGVPVALKLVAMSAALFLPVTTYAMGWLLGWSLSARLLAAAATTGFLVNTGNSIWGGNFLSQLSGEFANNWGFLFLPLFLGSVNRALTDGKAWRKWGITAIFLALAIALSHGYVWLMALAGGGLMAAVHRRSLRALATVATIHLTGAMLAGFWLIPFLRTGSWTIPNDGASQISLANLWPESLWPFGVAWLFLRVVPGLSAPLAVAMAGAVGVVAAPWIGLADVRFIPYAQWGVAVAGGAMVGSWLTVHSRRSVWWSLGLVALLVSWWPTFMSQAQGWSQWNMAGYQGKALAPEYQQLARFLARDLAAPRTAVEHHPYNDDLGSTRTVEALPLFGAGPVLEGLYMEAAITGPFIYQIQSEISRHPSSPLARYPAVGGDVSQAVAHLREFYTDTLVLRSPMMQSRFSQDKRFAIAGRFGPYQVVKLAHLDSALVEAVTTPLRAVARNDWMVTAYQRFILSHPYAERFVFMGDNQDIPMAQPAARCVNAQIAVEVMERDRLVFTTDQPGCPHLVRMSYHDFWQVFSGGSGKEEVFLVEPAFMVVFPASQRVEMRFDPGAIQGWGVGLSGMGLVVLLLLARRNTWLGCEGEGHGGAHGFGRRHGMLLVGIAGLVGVLHYQSPDYNYMAAHRLLAKEQKEEAARLFDKTWSRRKGWAKQAEGLFWGARTWELAGGGQEAAPRYRQLVAQFPASYWVAESLYRLAKLAQRGGDRSTYLEYRQQLSRRFPGNRWTAME